MIRRPIVIAALVVFATVTAQADDDQDAALPELAVEPINVIALSCRDPEGRPESWLDRSHAYMNRRLCEPAAWFDGFFGDPRADEETPVYTFFRWRNEIRWGEGEGTRYRARVFANVRLPRFSERLRLLVSRDEDIRGEFGEPSRREDASLSTTQLGLRYIISDDEFGQYSVEGGFLARFPITPFVAGRYRYTWPVAEDTQVRWTQTLFWERDDGVGTRTRVDWERLLSQDTMLRWSGGGTFSETSNGVEWDSSLTLFHQMTRSRAVRLETGLFGDTRPDYQLEEYYVNARFRSTFMRPWLFYEIQPEHAWTDRRGRGRESTWRAMFTLEVQFENVPGRSPLDAPWLPGALRQTNVQ